MANAHAHRHRVGKGNPCPSGCIYCLNRPSSGKFKNKNGHRRNPARKRGGRKNPAHKVQA
jgi:hypothetical protein